MKRSMKFASYLSLIMTKFMHSGDSILMAEDVSGSIPAKVLKGLDICREDLSNCLHGYSVEDIQFDTEVVEKNQGMVGGTDLNVPLRYAKARLEEGADYDRIFIVSDFMAPPPEVEVDIPVHFIKLGKEKEPLEWLKGRDYTSISYPSEY